MRTVGTPRCLLCNKSSQLEITDEEYTALVQEKLHIQRAMPNRDASFREMIMTGTHPECWEKIFEESEDEEDEDDG